MSQPAQILVVDDEASVRLTLGALLRRAGHTVTAIGSGSEAVALLDHQPFDLLLVDLAMPEMDGMQLVSAARQRQPDLAIIILTGHGSLATAVEALHQGIFDYLLKTTDPAQVVARVNAGLAARARQLRQHALLAIVGSAMPELRDHSATDLTAPPAADARRVISTGVLQLDTWRHTAQLGGRILALTPTEFRVLLCLVEHAGAMCSYAQLVRCAQGYEVDEVTAIELIKPHIHHLRQKMEPHPSAPCYILNVRNKGYLLEPTGQ
jgi:DNA-binding response OmpR family regulator